MRLKQGQVWKNGGRFYQITEWSRASIKFKVSQIVSIILPAFFFCISIACAEWNRELTSFLEFHCYDCHGDGAKKGGLAMDQLSNDLDDPATFVTWERIYDRAMSGEMPPKKTLERPSANELAVFSSHLEPPLVDAHSKDKGTVLRRLNRQEYENTLNDLMGTNLKLDSHLPEDGRSHEFDNVGESLSLSMQHLKKYIHAAGLVFDQVIKQVDHPLLYKKKKIFFREQTLKTHVGKLWKQLDDGAIVHFYGRGYPSGLLRESRVTKSGLYRFRITGYAYQSKDPITCVLITESYAPGSKKEIVATPEFIPAKPTTFEMKVWLDDGYMIKFDPQGIYRIPGFEHLDVNEYEGRGFAFMGAEIEGPLKEGYPRYGYDLIFDGIERKELPPNHPSNREHSWYRPKFEILCEDENKTIESFIVRMGSLAFRERVELKEMVAYRELYFRERAKGESIDVSLRTVFCAIFSSPRFLFLQERVGALSDRRIKDRLRLFLNRTLDDSLESKKDHKGAGLRAYAELLTKSEKFDRFIKDLTDNWLDLRNIDFTSPDRTLFPEFDDYLKHSMLQETRSFVRRMFLENLPISNLVKSDFAMVNERLAQHYGIDNVTGPKFRRVSLPANSPRGGLLTQGSILKVTANGTNTSPVMRGVWVMERILGQAPTPPPPGIPGVEPDIRGAETLRDLLEKHRSMESCQGCHAKFDPLGFALESFNPIGGYREHYRSLNPSALKVERKVRAKSVQYRVGPEVDSSGEFSDGKSFDDIHGFMMGLAENEKLLARAFVRKLLTFATGRELGFSDREEVERIVSQCSGGGYRAGDLLHAAISSNIFQSK